MRSPRIILLFLGFFFLHSTYGGIADEGKTDVEKYIELSASKGINCKYAGYAQERKIDLLRVFVNCTPQKELPEKIGSKEELVDAIVKYVAQPGISTISNRDNLEVVVITQVSEKVVLCNDIRKNVVVRSWFDSYDNYCWPD